MGPGSKRVLTFLSISALAGLAVVALGWVIWLVVSSAPTLVRMKTEARPTPAQRRAEAAKKIELATVAPRRAGDRRPTPAEGTAEHASPSVSPAPALAIETAPRPDRPPLPRIELATVAPERASGGQPSPRPQPAAVPERLALAPQAAGTSATGNPTATGSAPPIALASLDRIANDIMPPPPLEMRRRESEKPAPATDDIRIVSGFECSATLEVKRLTDTHFTVRFTGKRGSLDNYFLFRVEGAAGRTVRIDFEGAPLGKWWSLNPVYSYVEDLSDPANFTSEPLADPHPPVAAYNGPLLPDTRGEKWHFMPNVWSEKETRDRSRLCMVHTFEADSAYVGLKVPYTPSLNERIMASLEGNPHAQVFTIGHTPQGRPLQIVKIGGDEEADKSRPCVLMYGREHGTEQDSSWVVEGALRFLLNDDSEAKRLRERFTFLLIPVFDPDGAAMSFYDYRSGTFRLRDASPEALAYAEWFERWVDEGKRLDVALDMHNVESAEGEQLFNVFVDPGRREPCMQLHKAILDQFDGSFYTVSKRAGEGYTTTQLGGYLGYFYGPLPLLYEVNSQEKGRHLNLAETREMGLRLTVGCGSYLSSDPAQRTLAEIDHIRRGREQRLMDTNSSLTSIQRAHRLNWTTILAARERTGMTGD